MAISAEQGDAFARLVGKQPKDIKLALIENAADVYDDDSTDWADENREAIKARGYQVELLDLRNFKSNPKSLQEKLASKDAIWLGGGNTFYLRWVLKDTGADEIIRRLVSNGTVYGGGSAGAIVAGPTLKHFEDADDPHDSPSIVLEGLHLTDTVVVPHVANEKYGKAMEKIEARLKRDGYNTIAITDDQAVVFDGGKRKVIPSSKS